MKLNDSYFFTLREDVKNEESISGKLLVKSGMIRKTSSGIYMYLPFGFKVLENIKNIIRKEMNEAGCNELLMPILTNEEVFDVSGRKNNFGSEMFKLKDRYNKAYALGPTHEELFTIASSLKIHSYKDMPFNIYQFGTKFRDELRPRYGLIRVREFMMKDAYSFDINSEECSKSYNLMKDAYKNIMKECDLEYKIVKSDTGTMGGELSEEFQALTDIGEDTVISCDCGYSSNTDIAECYLEKVENKELELDMEQIHTPNAKTIKEISNLLNTDPKNFVKSLLYKTSEELICVLVSGEDDVNETKLSKLLNTNVSLASEEDIKNVSSIVGFVGPVNLNVKIYADNKIKNMKNFIVGANKLDYHIKNVNLKDFNVEEFSDLRIVSKGDLCPLCQKKLNFSKGIEVGNIFKLGDKYTKAFDVKYLDKENKEHYPVMGCYGIGLGRIMASVVEQHNDEFGIIWPYAIAPYKVSIVIVNTKDEEQVKEANNLYAKLSSLNIDVLLDDRDERAGVKFKDMDLIGIPIRITVGKRASEKIFEFKLREESEHKELTELEIIDYIKKIK